MSIVQKFQQVIELQFSAKGVNTPRLNSGASLDAFSAIESLVQEPLPSTFKELYEFADGQSADDEPAFLGDGFMSLQQITHQLQFSWSLVKPTNRNIPDPERSEQLIREIIAFYTSKAPKAKLFGLKKAWYKMEFSCGDGSFGGPYLYETEATSSKERTILKIDYTDYQKITPTIQALKKLEESSFNWDEMEFVLYENGHYTVERKDYNLNDPENFSSVPEGAVKRIYFHYKWLPLFEDFGGNYIGIDLDPDTAGQKGQVIVFGRDEEVLTVLAPSLDAFFDKVLADLSSGSSVLLQSERHVHDLLRKL